MKKVKFLKAAAILFALLFTVTGVAYADNDASKFTDIDNSWAKQHIINVYNKGLMGGATETQFKPGDHVKNYDALVSISRMVNREKDINLEQLAEKYQVSIIEKYDVPEYAREAVLICLGEGIVTSFEVEEFANKPYATKISIAKYLGVAFGVTIDKDAPPVVLSFKDAMYIPTLYKPYVKFLIDNGVVNSSGEFKPNDPIDRAAFAKMLDISSSVYDKDNLGIDTSMPDNGSSDTSDDAGFGTDNSWTDTGSDNPPVVIDDGEEADIVAYVDEVIAEYGNLAVFVGTERRTYKIAENAECIIDEVSSGYWKLKKSDMVKLYIQDGKVVKIVGESKIRKIVGKLVDIQSSDKTVLTVETLNGDVRNFTITAKTIVIKDGRSALWQELKNGNSLVITTSYDELIEINADGVKSTDKGVIESIVYSRIAPPKLVITALDGSQNTYYSNKNAEIAGASGDVYSLRPGMHVQVNLVDDEISKIEVINETATIHAEFKGMIKSIDKDARIIVVEVKESNTDKYVEKKIFVTSDTKIVYVDLISLEIKSLDIGSLKANQTISIIGTGTAEGVVAQTIQLMN